MWCDESYAFSKGSPPESLLWLESILEKARDLLGNSLPNLDPITWETDATGFDEGFSLNSDTDEDHGVEYNYGPGDPGEDEFADHHHGSD